MYELQPSPEMTFGSSADVEESTPPPRRTLAGALAQHTQGLAPPSAYWDQKDQDGKHSQDAEASLRLTDDSTQARRGPRDRRRKASQELEDSNGYPSEPSPTLSYAVQRRLGRRLGQVPKNLGPTPKSLLNVPLPRPVPTRFKRSNLSGLRFGIIGRDGVFAVEHDTRVLRGEVEVDRSKRAIIMTGNGFQNNLAFRLSASFDSIVEIIVAGSSRDEIILKLRLALLVEAWISQDCTARFAALDMVHRDKGPFIGKHLLLDFTSSQVVSAFVHSLFSVPIPRPSFVQFNVLNTNDYSPTLLARVRMYLGSQQKPYSFQLEAMLFDGTLLPDNIMYDLDEGLDRLDQEYQVEATEAILVEFRRLLKAEIRLGKGPLPSLSELLETAEHTVIEDRERIIIVTDDAHHQCRHLILTPSGRVYEGPFVEQTSSVLRRFGREVDSFIRVTWADDDLSIPSISRLGGNIRNQLIWQPLWQGIEVGGRHYEYVGHSLSSLRSRTAFFMTPIPGDDDAPGLPLDEDGDPLLPDLTRAEDVRRLLGEWKVLASTPMLYAARVSQQFTTSYATIALDARSIVRIPDVTHYDVETTSHIVHSDGAGLVSTAMRDKIWDILRAEGRVDINEPAPDVLQIRIGGDKGIVVVDKSLKGERLALRRSQHKYKATLDREDFKMYINIVDWFRASPGFLNRPLISALDDLGVPYSVFQRLLIKAMGSVNNGRESLEGVAGLFARSGYGGGSRLLSLVKNLVDLDPDSAILKEPSLLKDCVDLMAARSFRDLKDAARIPVPDSYNVVGVPDFDGTLPQGSVYCAVREPSGNIKFFHGRVLIARPPVVDPGDLRIMDAIGEVPKSSPLHGLLDCVVFSTQGRRSITSTMGGGDLDGDQYLVIDHEALVPHDEVEPLPHTAPSPARLERTGTMHDVAADVYRFFTEDNLGLIATEHLAHADKNPLHGFSSGCRTLAEQHGVATDSIKTGVFVPSSEVLRVGGRRPHFLKKEGESPDGYYQSKRALGRLYDLVPKSHLEFSGASKTYPSDSDAFVALREQIVQRTIELLGAAAMQAAPQEHVEMARRLRLSFVSQLLQTAEVNSFPRRPGYHLSEVELLVGVIFGDAPNDKLGRRNATERAKLQIELMIRALDDALGAGVVLGKKLLLLFTCHDEACAAQDDAFGNEAYKLVTLALVLETIKEIEETDEGWKRHPHDRALPFPERRPVPIIPPNFSQFNPSIVHTKSSPSRNTNTKIRRKRDRAVQALNIALQIQAVEKEQAEVRARKGSEVTHE